MKDTTLASYNYLRLWNNLLEKQSFEKPISTTDDKMREEKLQYNINSEAAKVSALLLGKIDKYEDLAVEETLPPDQSRMIEQHKFTYAPLGKALEKQNIAIENQGRK